MKTLRTKADMEIQLSIVCIIINLIYTLGVSFFFVLSKIL
jgi:hypothetical protein